jgi:hypothetical protein
MPSVIRTNTRMGCQRSKYRTFAKLTVLFLVAVVIDFFPLVFPPLFYLVFLILLLIFSYLYSYLLHFLSFSCATIHYSSPQLFLPIFIHCLPLTSHTSPQLPLPVTTLPRPLPHLLPTDSIQYKLCTPSAPCNPALQQWNYTQTHPKFPKPCSPHLSTSTYPSFAPLLV